MDSVSLSSIESTQSEPFPLKYVSGAAQLKHLQTFTRLRESLEFTLLQRSTGLRSMLLGQNIWYQLSHSIMAATGNLLKLPKSMMKIKRSIVPTALYMFLKSLVTFTL